MPDLILPPHFRCMAMGCKERKQDAAWQSEFCEQHWFALPSELKHEFMGARREAKGKNYVTGRMRSSFENCIRFLATEDRKDASKPLVTLT